MNAPRNEALRREKEFIRDELARIANEIDGKPGRKIRLWRRYLGPRTVGRF